MLNQEAQYTRLSTLEEATNYAIIDYFLPSKGDEGIKLLQPLRKAMHNSSARQLINTTNWKNGRSKKDKNEV